MEYYNEYNDGMLMSFAGLIWIGIICIYGLCVYGTYKYAKRLGRSGSWGVLAVLMSPFLASFVLCLMGRRTRTVRPVLLRRRCGAVVKRQTQLLGRARRIILRKHRAMPMSGLSSNDVKESALCIAESSCYICSE